jgi:predicted kinase
MIIIVLGLPGSGKSYFASRFAKLIHADYINSDRIRKSMFPARSYSEREKASVYNEMLELMRQAIRQDKDLKLRNDKRAYC